jgi:hypothetical protein
MVVRDYDGRTSLLHSGFSASLEVESQVTGRDRSPSRLSASFRVTTHDSHCQCLVIALVLSTVGWVQLEVELFAQ